MRQRIAALAATALLALAPAGGAVRAQTLAVDPGTAAAPIEVAVSRAVVVRSDRPFSELSIANPEIADISTLSDRSIYVLGRAPGRTSLTLFDTEGGLISNVEVQVTPDLTEFKERLGQILPGEPIDVRSAGAGLVLSGTVSSTARLDRALELARLYAGEQVSNLMTVGGTQQVMLKVRFAEMQRSVRKGLAAGVTASDRDVGPDQTFGVNSASGRGRLLPGAVGDGDATVLDIVPDVVGSAAIGIGTSSAALGILVDALEERRAVRTLAEPNLSALSGQEARFLAGGEFPVPVAQEDGVITIEFKPFGIELAFIPHVVDGGVINLELSAAVSSLDPASGITQESLNIDAFRRRETSTTVEMRDGESFAIAGLVSDDFEDAVDQVPFLGDLPVLGTLFRSTSYQREQSELVVIVTAHLVSPVRGEAYVLPTDLVRLPTEREIFDEGRTELGGAAEVARQSVHGPHGYVLD
jgi:pilus assembly protein CpaC